MSIKLIIQNGVKTALIKKEYYCNMSQEERDYYNNNYNVELID